MKSLRTFRLEITHLTSSGALTLCLKDDLGKCRSRHTTKIDLSSSLWRGVLETEKFLAVDRNRFPAKERDTGKADVAILKELGHFLRRQILGEQMASCLYKERPSLLLVQIASQIFGRAADLIRIPWELTMDQRGRTLSKAGIAVQMLPYTGAGGPVPQDRAAANSGVFNPNGPLRILVVLAQGRGQVAMAVRRVREHLSRLFLGEIASGYQVHLEIIQYPATTEDVRAVVRQCGGYHLVHIVAHGHHDLLVMEDEDGRDVYVPGDELADCLGGHASEYPHLVFLSACHSGDVRLLSEETSPWQKLRCSQSPVSEASSDRRHADLGGVDDVLSPDYTGTAVSLLRAGVPQVLAMRYKVSEWFALEFATTFYRQILLRHVPPALAVARSRVMAQQAGKRRACQTLDWLSPVLLGGTVGTQPIHLVGGRSDCADQLWVRGQLPDELHPVESFVGRDEELRFLHRKAFSGGAEKAVAVISGMGGLGKTALLAEAIHLWHTRFDLVVGTHSRGGGEPVSLRAWLHEVGYYAMTYLGWQGLVAHDETRGESGEYWLKHMLDEIVALLNRHRVLLILDNFDSNLKCQGVGPAARYVCTDPEWSAALKRLAQDLRPGMNCLLVASRHAPSELAEQHNAMMCRVGPLDPGDCCVFARTSARLGELLSDEAGRTLLSRVLCVARGHPLLLTLLDSLAANRADLAHRLDEFADMGSQYKGLGELLTAHHSDVDREREAAYLEDITTHSVRRSIESLSPSAKRLLWVVVLALEEVHDRLIEAVWDDLHWGGNMPRLEPKGQGWQASLGELLEGGLLSPRPRLRTTEAGEIEDCTAFVWHPIVAEEATRLMSDESGFPLKDYLRRYAEVHASGLTKLGCPENPVQARMLVESSRLAIRYLMRLGDLEAAAEIVGRSYALSDASGFRQDMRTWIDALLMGALPDAQRDRLRVALADLYVTAGMIAKALPLYHEAAASLKRQEDWHNCAVVYMRLGVAMTKGSDYTGARAAFRASLRYYRNTDGSYPSRLVSLVELVRLLLVGADQDALGRARRHAARLARVAEEYHRGSEANHIAENENVPVDRVELLLLTLELEREVQFATHNWAAAKGVCEQMIKLKIRYPKYDMAQDRGNLAVCLMQLGLLDGAEQQFLYCLEVFRDRQMPQDEATALMQLAQIAGRKNEPDRARQFAIQGLNVFHRLCMPADMARAHRDVATYSEQEGHMRDAVLHACCAALIAKAVGHQGILKEALGLLGSFVTRLPKSYYAKHWPKVGQILNAYPRVAELLAARGFSVGGTQRLVDLMWTLLWEDGDCETPSD